MSAKINFYLLEFALGALARQRSKTVFISVVLSLLIALLSSFFFIANSIKHELLQTLDTLPEITLQKLQGGKHTNIETSAIDSILLIHGVEDANARVWGYYYFGQAQSTFVLIGLDPFEEHYTKTMQQVVQKYDFMQESRQLVVGQGVKDILKSYYYTEEFNFIKPDGGIVTLPLSGVFNSEIELESNDMMVVSKESAREIFAIADDMATDIVIQVANPQEVATVASKLQLLFPDARVITKEAIQISYKNIIDYKSGVFLTLFIVSLFTFFMIIYDKLSGLSSEEKREVGILKALGWKVELILKEKFYEAFIISCISYILGVGIALFYVYILQAPLLRSVFEGYSKLRSSFELPFVLDLQTLSLIFFLSVPIYVAATIVPAWRAAIQDADEVIR